MSEDEILYEDYVPTAYDPGWQLTFVVIVTCIFINALLPCFLYCAKKRDREKIRIRETSNKEDTYDDEHSIRGDGSVASFVSIDKSVKSSASIFSEVASLVLESRANKTHRSHQYKRNGRRTKERKLKGPEARYFQNDDDSILSALEEDAVSVSDAIDTENVGKHSIQKEVVPILEKLLVSSTWDIDMKKLISLWIPYTISGAADGFFQIINVGIISHYIGTKEANAYIIVVILVEFTSTLTYGWEGAVGVLGPQADGVGNKLLIGRYMQLGIIFTIILSIPGIIIWSICAKDAVMWFGFDEETAIIGQNYVYPLLVGIIFDGPIGVLESFLEFMGHERYTTFMIVLLCGLETVGLMVAAFLGVKDLLVVGFIQVGIGLLVSLLNLWFVLYKGWLDGYWEGLTMTNGLKDKKAVRNMTRTAIPLCLSYILTYGEWEAMTIFASHIGPYEVAAWGMLGFVWDTFEYIIHGLSDAAEVRVGFRMGGGEPDNARASAYKAMYLAVVISIYGTAILYSISGYLPVWLTTDPTLQQMIYELLPLVGFGQIIMSVGMVCWSILYSQGRVRLATIMEFVCSWFVVMPAAGVLVYVFNFNLLGLVGPLVVGYTVGGAAIMYLFFRSDWETLSAKVIARNGGVVSYDKYDWDDLRYAVQDAAHILGYTADLWDNDKEKESPIAKKDWDELTSQERKAAKRLGFNRSAWDEDNSNGGSKDTQEIQSRSSNDTKSFDHLSWSKLPPEAMEAALTLGYTSRIWDTDKEPKNCQKAWKQLSSEERKAAIALGYDEQKWDGDHDDDSITKKDKDIEVQELSNIEVESKNRSRKESSSPGKSPKKEKKKKKKRKKKKTSSKSLTTSLEVPSPEARSKFDEGADSKMKYDNYGWKKLSKEVRDAAMILGYTKSLWDNDKEPDTCDKHWKKLTPEEQEAAKTLGFNEQSWDED